MNINQLYKYIGAISEQIPLVHSYSNKSVYDYWNMDEVKYGSVCFSVQNVSAGSHTTTYTGILYYGDRLMEDRSNIESVYSDATLSLQTIINTLSNSDDVEVSFPIQITYFEQEFADQLAGAYANLTITVEGVGQCGFDGTILPTPIYPGEDGFDAENYYTKSQVDALLDRYDAIVDEKLEGYAKDTDLASYVTKTELEEKGYIDHIPANLVTESELNETLDRKGYLTSIPSGYVTESELDEKLQKDGYLKEIPAKYVTEQELAEKGFLTHIPSNYVTDAKLESKGYLTEIPAKYVTETELDEKGYLTEVPPYYVTESELSKYEFTSKDYVDALVGDAFHSDDYYTKQEVNEGFASKAYVADEIVKVQSGGEVDLSGYVTKLELNDKHYLTSIPSDYVTESELASKGYLTEIPAKYVTEAELESKRYLTEIPSYYVTESELESKRFLTEIPSYYVTESELEANGYLKEIPPYYVTESELADQGYATKEYVKQQVANVEVDLTDYATKSYVDAEIDKIQAGDVDLSDYYTKTESNNRFATKAYVAEEIAKVQSGGSIDLSGYVTDQELEDALKDVNVDLTGYATESYVNGLVGDINSILNSVLNDI